MTWKSDFAKDIADGYGDDGSMEPHYQHHIISVAGSMDTSISDQAILWAAIVRGEGLNPFSRAELIRPQIPIRSPHQFPTITTETTTRNDGIGLAAGLAVAFCFTSLLLPVARHLPEEIGAWLLGWVNGAKALVRLGIPWFDASRRTSQ